MMRHTWLGSCNSSLAKTNTCGRAQRCIVAVTRHESCCCRHRGSKRPGQVLWHQSRLPLTLAPSVRYATSPGVSAADGSGVQRRRLQWAGSCRPTTGTSICCCSSSTTMRGRNGCSTSCKRCSTRATCWPMSWTRSASASLDLAPPDSSRRDPSETCFQRYQLQKPCMHIAPVPCMHIALVATRTRAGLSKC